MSLNQRLPVVIGRAVKAQLAAGARHSDLLGAREELQPVTEDEVIIGHGSGPPLGGCTQKDGPLLFSAAKSNLSGRLVGSSA
jgi:hypothetical protein